MPKKISALDLGTIALSQTSGEALHRQVYHALRDAILDKRLKPGMRLPSTRSFSSSLSVSRNTVLSAFEQLIAEGFLESRVGDGSYVSLQLPDDLIKIDNRSRSTPKPAAPHPPIVSQRYRNVIAAPRGGYGEQLLNRAFRTGLAALDEFPTQIWARLIARQLRHAPSDLLAYGAAAGYQPLRESIAAYLGNMRSIPCSPDQVIITAASQEALITIAQVLLNPGDQAWMEDPGYQGARSALIGAGAHLVPVQIDDEGMRVDDGVRRAPNARLAYITPSYQYPMGVTMTLARRLALLDWAKRANAWIIEDDYNSEYRYTGRPLAALYGLDKCERVIYVGTFSKLMFGALRIGYMVVPPALVDIFVRARGMYHQFLSGIDQAALNDFIVDGHFARHIRRMRELYVNRRGYLIRMLDQECAGMFEVCGAEAGLHILARLPVYKNDTQISEKAAALGIEVQPLSHYAMQAQPKGGLTLGYGALNERRIREGVRKLGEAVL